MTFDLLSFDPKINLFPGLMVEHVCVKFGDPSCSGILDIVRIHRQTDRQTDTQINTCEKSYSRD